MPSPSIPVQPRGLRRFGSVCCAALIGLCLGFPGLAAEEVAPVASDVVILLDNSASMRKNDPQFELKQRIEGFARQFSPDTRLAVLLFDKRATLTEPLIPMSPDGPTELRHSLEKLDYRGIYTDSASAIARAIFELKANGRADAGKAIVLLSDGVIDTGSRARDRDYAPWLRDQLTAEASAASIRIYTVAIGDKADFPLFHAVAQKTGGEYFRVDRIGDLDLVFQRIRAGLAAPSPVKEHASAGKPAPEPPPSEPIAKAPEPLQPPSEPVPVTPLSNNEPAAASERSSAVTPIAAGVLGLLALGGLIWLRKSRRPQPPPGARLEPTSFLPEAYLHDLYDVTGCKRRPLTHAYTWLGRLARKLEADADQIVIDRPTVSRQHALIEFRNHSFWLIDQNSINGTYVNDHRVDGEVRLKDGDIVRLCGLEFRFEMPVLSEGDITVMLKPGSEDETDRDGDKTVTRSMWNSFPLPSKKEVKGAIDDYFKS